MGNREASRHPTKPADALASVSGGPGTETGGRIGSTDRGPQRRVRQGRRSVLRCGGQKSRKSRRRNPQRADRRLSSHAAAILRETRFPRRLRSPTCPSLGRHMPLALVCSSHDQGALRLPYPDYRQDPHRLTHRWPYLFRPSSGHQSPSRPSRSAPSQRPIPTVQIPRPSLNPNLLCSPEYLSVSPFCADASPA